MGLYFSMFRSVHRSRVRRLLAINLPEANYGLFTV